MTDDIVTRLRNKFGGQLPICAEAADEIERLRTDRDKWKYLFIEMYEKDGTTDDMMHAYRKEKQ
jgi:uncharacterized protein (DUF1919 family)